jgi:hypothetical protein
MLSTLILCAALTAPERDFRVETQLATDVLTGTEAPWLGETTTAWRFGTQRHLLDFIGSFWVSAGATLRPGATEIATTLSIADAGLVFELPVWRRFFPYARAALEGVWVHVDAGPYSGDAVTGGLQLGGGLRFQPSPTGRFFLVADATYSQRLAVDVKLEAERDDDAIEGPATPLGELDVSGWSGRLGMGLAF